VVADLDGVEGEAGGRVVHRGSEVVGSGELVELSEGVELAHQNVS
jgi:hypothetical protein